MKIVKYSMKARDSYIDSLAFSIAKISNNRSGDFKNVFFTKPKYGIDFVKVPVTLNNMILHMEVINGSCK